MRHSIVQFIPRSLSETKEEDKVAVEEEEDDHAADVLQSTQKKTGWRRRASSWGCRNAGKMPHAPSIAMTEKLTANMARIELT